MSVDTILHNAKITTNGIPSFVEALAIDDGTNGPPPQGTHL